MSDELDLLRDDLLHGRPGHILDGAEAFERHQLLAIRIHRAVLVDSGGRSNRQGAAWCDFFAAHFPREDDHGELLWDEWRVPLLKAERPGEGVVITHGRPDAHWKTTDRGLVIDLESMWNDFEVSVEGLIAALRADETKRVNALAWWRENQWTIETVTFPALRLVNGALSASVGSPVSRAVGPVGVTATGMVLNQPPLPPKTQP